jgi:hypothetical protein
MAVAEKFHIGPRGERISEEDRRTIRTSKRKARTGKHSILNSRFFLVVTLFAS